MHVRTCRDTPPMNCVKHVVHDPQLTHQKWTQSAKPFLRYRNAVCTCAGVSLHVRTCTPRFCISQTARPIEFKFGVWVSSHYLSAFHKSWVGYLCTCARADRVSVSQERLGRLSPFLVCELGVMNYVLNTIHGWGISARAHVHTAPLYLRNDLTDCVQIWYVGWSSLSKCFPQVMGEVKYLCTCARGPPSPYLRIRVSNCAKI